MKLVDDFLKKNTFPFLFSIVLLLLLSACGVGDTGPGETQVSNPPTISINASSTTEGDSGFVSLNFTVKLSAPLNEDIVFEYSTIDGSALSKYCYS